MHQGSFDVDSTLWALARRQVPLHVIKRKLDAYIAEDSLPPDQKDRYIELFEQMQGTVREHNIYADPATTNAAATETANSQMSRQELQA